jgi:predicted lipoprotein
MGTLTIMNLANSRLVRMTVLAAAVGLLAASLPQSSSAQTRGDAVVQLPKPASSGYAEAAEGLRVHYEVYGQGEPIVVLAGGLMDIARWPR